MLRPKFRTLFTEEELGLARGRLDEYGFQSRDEEDELLKPVDIAPPEELLALVEEVEHASGLERIEHRDAFAAFGVPARELATSWLHDEYLTAFAIGVLERMTQTDRMRPVRSSCMQLEAAAIRHWRQRPWTG